MIMLEIIEREVDMIAGGHQVYFCVMCVLLRLKFSTGKKNEGAANFVLNLHM